MSDIAQQDYVRNAHAKGLSRPNTWLHHVLPSVAVPMLTALGVSLRSWPGLGAAMLKAVCLRQPTLVITLALALGLTFMLLNLLLELAYRFLDPRLSELTSRHC